MEPGAGKWDKGNTKPLHSLFPCVMDFHPCPVSGGRSEVGEEIAAKQDLLNSEDFDGFVRQDLAESHVYGEDGSVSDF